MAKKTPKQRRKRQLSTRGKLIIILFVLAILSAAAYIGYDAYDYRFGRAIAKDCTVQVPRGATFAQAARMLADSGFINSPRRWESMAAKHDLDTVQCGNYQFAKGTSYRTALGRLAYGKETPVRLTFNNIRTLERLAAIVGKQIEPDSAALIRALRNDSLIRAEGFSPATFPVMFIPNTYEVYWSLSPEAFVQRMHKEYNRFWNDERLAKATALGLSPAEVSILASIVIEETKFQGEMTRVAGVYLNRLKIGMPLQADPTVKFAVGDPTLKRVLNRHLEHESPYNTYLHAGLPPGPIYIPPVNVIDAVLGYADPDNHHNYLYFCANADFSGKHVFALTLAEHNRNAAAYAAELNRRGIR